MSDWTQETGMTRHIQDNAVKNYLDDKIRYWRVEIRKRASRMTTAHASSIPVEKAISYIDAYQTMRRDLFGEALPDES